MSNEWLALRRVGEWAGLREDQIEMYLSRARPVHERALETRTREKTFDDLKSEYFKFLNESVLPADPIVQYLKSENIAEGVIRRFETGSVPVADAFRKHSVVDYGLDEIVDFVMLLKLFEKYRSLTEDRLIQPLEKFHSLVYLVNYRLSQEDVSHSIANVMEFGMLEKTGYRYTFTKRDDYTWSESLQRDIDRLFAWKILDREVVENPRPEWEVTYAVSPGEVAELFLTRFEARLNEFDSVLLKEWEIKQERVLEDLADASKAGISNHLRSLNRFENSNQEEIVLNGRPKRFETQETLSKVTINV